MVDFRVSVVLPAGGCGSRMAMDIPKQYVRIFDRPLISYTIEAFECISWIENIVVVGPPVEDQKEILKNIVLEFNHKKVITTNGGSTRHRSIFNGVQCLNTIDLKPDVVVIHDAVRPFVEETLLKDIVVAAHKHGACGAVRPLVSTVLARNHDGFLDHSLDRSKYIASEMPQAFQYDVIFNAYRKCTKDELDYGTECLQLALKYSHTPAFLLDGPAYLWKVTHKKDLFAAEGIIKDRFRQYAKIKGNNCDLQLEKITKTKFKAKAVKVVEHAVNEDCKTNIMVNFRLSNPDSKTSSSEKIVNEMALDLEDIEQNGILVIVQRGTPEDLKELKIATQNIARRAKENNVICCAVWCENFVMNQKDSTCGTINEISEIIVSVALETPRSFSGQVFTFLDT